METKTIETPDTVETVGKALTQAFHDHRHVERQELVEDGYDLPELADSMEEAYARASASSYLFALRNVERDVDANDAEFSVLQDFNRRRHVARQETLLGKVQYLRDSIRTLFGFMTVTGKKKSLNLLGGRVGMRAKQDGMVVDDVGAVIEWAQKHGFTDLVKMKPTLDLKALRTHIVAQRMDPGIDPEYEPPPGVTLKSRPDEFFATPATD